MESSSINAFVDVGQKVFLTYYKGFDTSGQLRKDNGREDRYGKAETSCIVQTRCITMRRRSELGTVNIR